MLRKRRRKRKADLVKVKLDCRVTEATAARLRQGAKDNDRSLSDYMHRMLKLALDAEEGKKG